MNKNIKKISVLFLFISFIYYTANNLKFLKKKKMFVYVNKPCDKLLPAYPDFVNFHNRTEAYNDFIYINFDKYPFIVFHDSLDFKMDTVKKHNITGLKFEEIKEVFKDNAIRLKHS